MDVPVVCSRCGEEVRWGWRAGYEAWWHRSDVDHQAILGHTLTQADLAEIEHQMDLPRTKLDSAGREVVYTTRNWKQTRRTKGDQDDEENEGKTEETWDGTVPEPELVADHTSVPWPLRKSVPNGVWLVLKPALAAGLEVSRLTLARGPWLHAGGHRPAIQETWVLAIRAAWLDSGTRAAVGCWRNKGDKWEYDHGLLITDNHGEFVPSAAIKQWIKTLEAA